MINQSINQSNKQSINQSINQSNKHDSTNKYQSNDSNQSIDRRPTTITTMTHLGAIFRKNADAVGIVGFLSQMN